MSSFVAPLVRSGGGGVIARHLLLMLAVAIMVMIEIVLVCSPIVDHRVSAVRMG